jgi:hypothetical protein
MAITTDIWAVTPSYSATLFRAAAAIGGVGDITLLTNQPLDNGAGYKILFTCAGDATAAIFTITGYVAGDLSQSVTTETVAGVDADTATSVNYYSKITSISSDAAVATNVSIGNAIADGMALPRSRMKGFYFVGSAGAGSVTLTLDGNAASDRVLLSIATPANVESQQMSLPGDGILINGNEPQTTFGVVTQTTAVTSLTVFCG